MFFNPDIFRGILHNISTKSFSHFYILPTSKNTCFIEISNSRASSPAFIYYFDKILFRTEIPNINIFKIISFITSKSQV